jgi:uncharacterized protein YegP (UPF0339 family)
MSRQPRFEICRGDDGDAQPWWARYRAANGRIVWVTENYERRSGAEKAVHLIARSFWGFASFGYDEIGALWIGDGGEGCVEVREVREVDERDQP